MIAALIILAAAVFAIAAAEEIINYIRHGDDL